MKMNGKIVLIDGHSILNRAFYGVPLLSNASGLHTNGVYGFLNILFKILEEEEPDYLTVAFDVSAPTFRHQLYEDYKGTRKPMPQELHEQVPVLKELLQAMGIQICEKAGLEADDILGTLAKRGEKEGLEVSLVSGDRDLLQIATEHIKIRIPKTKGARTEIEDYYGADVKAKYHVTPLQFIELKALMGDTADNIPGVPKIGEKTATALMEEYGSIDAIYENLEAISKKSIRESLRENRALADLSRELATIQTEAEFPFSFEKARMHNLYTKEAYQICKELEFKNLLKRFQEQIPEEENMISKEEVAIYRYGYILVCEVFINIIIAAIIAGISGEWLLITLFCVIYIPLRSFCGGWHADKLWKCTIYSNFIIILMIIGAEYMVQAFTGILLFVLFIICLLGILCMAPMDTKSKPISKEERKVYKNKIHVIVLVHLFIFIAMVLAKWNTIMYVIDFSYVTQVVMLFLEKISRKK